MKLIDVQQGSSEWLSWRKTVITATDCPAILGSSPWVTAYQCWQRKLGMLPEQEVNASMERGRLLEPIAREEFVAHHGIDMEPVVVESTEYDFLGASLDGISQCGKYILEIKCGGNKLHSMAKEGKIPQYYQDQIQHQLLVTGVEKAYYYSFDGVNGEGITLEVLPDPEFRKIFIPKAKEFWKCIAFMEPPPLQDLDYKDMSADPRWQTYSEKYCQTVQMIKDLEELKEKYREELLRICGDNSCIGNGLKAIKTITRGRINYEDIPEIKDVDLNKYRKPPTTTWKLLVS